MYFLPDCLATVCCMLSTPLMDSSEPYSSTWWTDWVRGLLLTWRVPDKHILAKWLSLPQAEQLFPYAGHSVWPLAWKGCCPHHMQRERLLSVGACCLFWLRGFTADLLRTFWLCFCPFLHMKCTVSDVGELGVGVADISFTRTSVASHVLAASTASTRVSLELRRSFCCSPSLCVDQQWICHVLAVQLVHHNHRILLGRAVSFPMRQWSQWFLEQSC